MTNPAIDQSALGSLRGAGFRGALVLPSDPAYDAARRVYNGMVDRTPSLIARCSGTADVVAAVRFCRERGLDATVRGGGHGVAGHAVADGAVMIDCTPMKGIRVDPQARTAWAQAGVIFSELDRETQVFGLATPGGTVSRTGIAGFTLGGGVGWLSARYGMACANLVAADVVTAEGEVLHASEREHGDLLWALRGGGGNFGIVTAFEYRLYPVTQLGVCIVMHPAEKAAEVLRLYRKLSEPGSEEVVGIAAFMTAPPLPFVPPAMVGTPAIAIIAAHLGDPEGAEAKLAPLKEFGSPPVALVTKMPYVALQQMLDASAPDGMQNYWTAEFLPELPDAAIDALVQRAGSMPVGPSMLHTIFIGGPGVVAREDSGAFSTRGSKYLIHVIGIWPDPADSARNVAWARETREALVPYGAGGGYLNFTVDEGVDRVQAAFGPEKYRRLAELKARYDPDNFFRHNQNVRPQASLPADAPAAPA